MWSFGAPPVPPPPPPPMLSSEHALVLIKLFLSVGTPCLFLASQGIPYNDTAKAPLKSTVMRKMQWYLAVGFAARRARTIFALNIVFTFSLGVLLRLTVFGDAQTSKQIHGGADEVASKSSMADLVAYNTTSILFAIYSSYVGLKAWFDGTAAKIGATAMDRMYAHSSAIEELCAVITGYESFNLLAVIVLPEYRSAAFIGHHAVTLALGVMSLHPWCHYYGIFFFGVASTSSIPLCLGEMLNAIDLPGAADLAKPAFVLLFFTIRTAYWPYVSLGFWRDSLWALASPMKRVHSYAAYVLLLLANIFLTGLQVMWTIQICDAAADILRGDASH